MSFFEDFKEMCDKLAALPEPVAYIVLDHGWSLELPAVDGHDNQGRRYVLCSPALLDEMKHTKWKNEYRRGSLLPLEVPIYRRENMPEGWPEK